MYEILERLQSGALVLDLGCRNGSFPIDWRPDISVVRVDLAGKVPGLFVRADAQRLPFPAGIFDAVVLSHTLEHLENLKLSLQEIGRTVKSNGAAFVAVPDARTLSDRIYRKAYRDAGGHVNLFDCPRKLEEMVTWYLGMPHIATRALLTSFSFLNRNNMRDEAVRKQARFIGLPEVFVALATAGARLVERRLNTRTGVYGWAMYFGRIDLSVDLRVTSNVCVRCGQGHTSSALRGNGRLVKRFRVPTYRCPDCGAVNIFFEDTPAPPL